MARLVAFIPFWVDAKRRDIAFSSDIQAVPFLFFSGLRYHWVPMPYFSRPLESSPVIHCGTDVIGTQ